MTDRRYAMQPLLDAMGLSLRRAAVVLGISGRTRNRLLDVGLTDAQADRYAIRAGLHPFEVWPEMGQHALVDAATAEEQARERRLAADRRRKAERRQDPAYRAAQAAYLRDYRASDRAKAVARRYRRAYYEANRDRELARQRQYDATVRAQRSRTANEEAT